MKQSLQLYIATLLMGMGMGMWFARLIGQYVDAMHAWITWNGLGGALLFAAGVGLFAWAWKSGRKF
jgi:xanthine/uracil permease